MVKKSLEDRHSGTPPQLIHNPELVFGIVGPIGVELDALMEALGNALRAVNYRPAPIHLTELMRNERVKVKLDFTTYHSRYLSLIRYANTYCRLAKSRAALAGLAIKRIRELRAGLTRDANSPARGTAYIVRQFKRPEEIELMRRVYGRKFVQVSVFGSALERREVLINKIRRYEASQAMLNVNDKQLNSSI
jgi:hypothetical protein